MKDKTLRKGALQHAGASCMTLFQHASADCMTRPRRAALAIGVAILLMANALTGSAAVAAASGNVGRARTAASGNVSRAVDTASGRQFSDVKAGQWFEPFVSELAATGIISGYPDGSFRPQEQVTVGQFLAMVTQLLEIPVDAQHAQLAEEAPIWLKPYLTAALRSGLLAGWPENQPFSPEAPVTGAQAAVILQNALDLPVSMETVELEAAEAPTWEEMALHAMAENGLELAADQVLSRAETAKLLYRVNTLAQNAPGMYAIRAAQQ